MRKSTLVSFGAIVALSVGLLIGTGVAAAQETGPNSKACGDAKQRVERLEKDLSDALFDERKREENKLDKAKKDREAARIRLDAAQVAVDDEPEDSQAETKELADAKAVFNAAKDDVDKAQKDLDRDSDDVKGLRSRLDDARDRKTVDCGDLSDDPSTTPQTPAPPPFVDLNCSNFPLSDGTTAQQMLDRDRTDPHGLDANSNGIACDIDEPAPTTDPAPPVDNSGVGNVTTPSGGVATGGGPE